jgi:hypothetical protein
VAVPTINAFINFSTGASFATAFAIGTGVLGEDVLSDALTPPLIVDVSSQVDKVDTKRGRDPQADQFQTGQLTLRIVDQNGDFNPQNTSSPYFGLLDPMRKVKITATWQGIEYPIFVGYITSYTTTTPKDVGDIVYTTISAVDAFRLAQNAQISTVADSGAGQLSGTRINKILDAIGWPNALRDVDPGQTTLLADPGSPRTGLEALQKVEISEYGALYVDALGNFTFQDRALTVSSIFGTPVVFNDNGTGIEYFNAIWVLNDVLVYNSAQVSRSGGAVQTAINQDSIDKYFVHSYNQQDLLMQTDAEALNYARAYIASRAQTSTRCDAITLDLYTPNYNAGITAALDLDFFDPITITTTQPGASDLTKTLQVFGVMHSITPGTWKTQFTTLEAIIDGFIIGSPDYAILGTSVLSY